MRHGYEKRYVWEKIISRNVSSGELTMGREPVFGWILGLKRKCVKIDSRRSLQLYVTNIYQLRSHLGWLGMVGGGTLRF